MKGIKWNERKNGNTYGKKEGREGGGERDNDGNDRWGGEREGPRIMSDVISSNTYMTQTPETRRGGKPRKTWEVEMGNGRNRSNRARKTGYISWGKGVILGALAMVGGVTGLGTKRGGVREWSMPLGVSKDMGARAINMTYAWHDAGGEGEGEGTIHGSVSMVQGLGTGHMRVFDGRRIRMLAVRGTNEVGDWPMNAAFFHGMRYNDGWGWTEMSERSLERDVGEARKAVKGAADREVAVFGHSQGGYRALHIGKELGLRTFVYNALTAGVRWTGETKDATHFRSKYGAFGDPVSSIAKSWIMRGGSEEAGVQEAEPTEAKHISGVHSIVNFAGAGEQARRDYEAWDAGDGSEGEGAGEEEGGEVGEGEGDAADCGAGEGEKGEGEKEGPEEQGVRAEGQRVTMTEEVLIYAANSGGLWMQDRSEGGGVGRRGGPSTRAPKSVQESANKSETSREAEGNTCAVGTA